MNLTLCQRATFCVLLGTLLMACAPGAGVDLPSHTTPEPNDSSSLLTDPETTDSPEEVAAETLVDPSLEGISELLQPLGGPSPRYALVFGNGSYSHGDALPAASNDAMLIAKALRNRGYHVLVGLDRRLAGMREDLHAFEQMSKGAEIRLMYFAGHGFEFGGENYLMPVDLPISIANMDERHVKQHALRLQDAAWPLEQEDGVVIAIIDACRVSPARGATSRLALGAANPPAGTILAYATSPGTTAADSLRAYGVNQDHSPYAYFLAGALSDPVLETWDEVLLSAANVVRTQTEGVQTPWMNAAVNKFPVIGTIQTEKAPRVGDYFGDLAASISPERKAAGRYWADREIKIAIRAKDRQVFDDELQAQIREGDEEAALVLGYRWSGVPGKERSAIALLEPLAEKGDAVAQLTLGTTLIALPARDSKGRKASYWWHQASANGVGEARAKVALAEGKTDAASLEEIAAGFIENFNANMAGMPGSGVEEANQEEGTDK